MKLSFRSLLLFLLIFGAASGAGAFACEMKFGIGLSGAKPQALKENAVIELKAGAEYALTLSYFEDHRNCLVKPEDTKVSLDGKAWTAQSAVGLKLLDAQAWTEAPARTQSAILRFVAAVPGTYVVGVDRACPKGGYSGTITVKVS